MLVYPGLCALSLADEVKSMEEHFTGIREVRTTRKVHPVVP